MNLQDLIQRAREEGWDVTLTTNVHLDRADEPSTGHVLIECFDEHGTPAHWAPGTDREGYVIVGGDKVDGAHDDSTDLCKANTVDGVMEWARYVFDAPDDPMPDLFGGSE